LVRSKLVGDSIVLVRPKKLRVVEKVEEYIDFIVTIKKLEREFFVWG